MTRRTAKHQPINAEKRAIKKMFSSKKFKSPSPLPVIKGVVNGPTFLSKLESQNRDLATINTCNSLDTFGDRHAEIRIQAISKQLEKQKEWFLKKSTYQQTIA